MNLESKTNKQALSFVTVYDLEAHIKPKFETLIASKLADLGNQTFLNDIKKELEEQGVEAPSTSVSENLEKYLTKQGIPTSNLDNADPVLLNQIEALVDGLQNWDSTLIHHDATNALKDSELPRVGAIEMQLLSWWTSLMNLFLFILF